MRQALAVFLLTVPFLLPPPAVIAQGSNPNPEQTQARITQEFIESQLYEANKGINNNREIEGSPYYNEDWNRGYFIKTNGKTTASYPMRFNIYKNQLEFKFDENTLYIASPKPIKGFIFTPEEGSRVTFKQGFKIPNSDISKNIFLQVLHDGKTKLLLHHNVQFIKGHAKDMFTGKIVDRYLTKSNYYFFDEKGQVEQIKLREKDILKRLKNLKNQLKPFIEKNDLNLKKEEDVVALLVEYDRLLGDALN